MAYTAVPTAYDGAPGWTATWLNKYVKDNFAAGVPDIFTTKGDIAIASSADVATRFAVGANTLILSADSTASSGLRWAGIGLIKANDSDSQTVSSLAKLSQLDNEYYDLSGEWASDRYTCSYPGYYLVTAMFQVKRVLTTWDADQGGDFRLYKNGAVYSYINIAITQGAGADYVVSTFGADIIYLIPGDYIEFYAHGFLGNQVTVNPNAEDVSHHISITYLPS